MTETTRIAISLAGDQTMQLKTAAAERDIPHGILATALVKHGLDNLDDPTVEEAIEREREQFKERRAAGGRAGMRSRYKDRPKKE